MSSIYIQYKCAACLITERLLLAVPEKKVTTVLTAVLGFSHTSILVEIDSLSTIDTGMRLRTPCC